MNFKQGVRLRGAVAAASTAGDGVGANGAPVVFKSGEAVEARHFFTDNHQAFNGTREVGSRVQIDAHFSGDDLALFVKTCFDAPPDRRTRTRGEHAFFSVGKQADRTL